MRVTSMSAEFYWLAVAVVVVLSSARLTRLATYDLFPPVMWLRNHFIEWTDGGDRRRAWQVLAFCGYCASFWLTGVVLLLGLWAGVLHGDVSTPATPAHPGFVAWWLVNGALGGSYLAAILMTHDGDDSHDESTGDN